MASDRAEKLIQRLNRGLSKSQEIFASLATDQWKTPIFDQPDSWNMRDLIAHFIYSEEHLLMIAKDIASGGEGSTEDIDIDAFNQEEMIKMKKIDIDELMAMLIDVRQSTIAWVQGLNDVVLDIEGRHPVLGTTNVENVIFSIYAHQLLHMRETVPRLKKE